MISIIICKESVKAVKFLLEHSKSSPLADLFA
uniref:Uncharacterized protein n=1 Tax=Rhizophora mucronata TaxID=61149 RepID=A0A2P2PGF8_RHIMU